MMRRICSFLFGLLSVFGWAACAGKDNTEAQLKSATDAIMQVEPGTVYYIHPEGGDTLQCNGLVDARYPGSGTGQPCAWDHPFRALPPGESPRIAGGNTLVIAAGSYRMGLGAPGADNPDVCSPDYPWDCTMPPIPSGPNEDHPTRILGAGWDDGCSQPPELWGTERAAFVINLTQSSNIEIACLEITDHVGCAEDHTGGMACEHRNYPYGNWAAVGLYAEDSTQVSLQYLDIHGLAVNGVHAGRLTDWTVNEVRIAANGWAGWDGDIEGGDSNAGELVFQHWIVEWNGCVETYPGEEPVGCWSQTAGGYGDGFGTGSTGGDWLIEDSAFLYNTSDGFDLLYHDLGGSITLRQVRAEGNAGNPVKVAGEARIENSVMVANCAFFDGQSFSYDVDPCRALGNALALSFTGGEEVQLINNTIYGQGDGLVEAGPREGFSCDGNERIFGRNNLFLGGGDYFDPGDQNFLFYFENCPGLTFDSDYSLYYDVKLSEYIPGFNDINLNPQIRGPFSGEFYNLELTAVSPAIDAGEGAKCPTDDYRGFSRPNDGNGDGEAICDIGAYEWNPDNAWLNFSILADASTIQ